MFNFTVYTGQEVFVVGYAFEENEPSTVFGHVHTISFSIMTTTCDIHTGFSGGPVFMGDKLLGLTIGKLSVGSIHFVLPSIEFVDIIKKYMYTNGKFCLNKILKRTSMYLI